MKLHFFCFFLLFLFSCNQPKTNRVKFKKKPTNKDNLLQIQKKFSFGKITEYSVQICTIKNNNKFITLRKFKDSSTGQFFCLILDITTLKTSIVKYDQLQLYEKIDYSSNKAFYFKLKRHVQDAVFKTQSGIYKVPFDGYVITVDLCPSAKQMDKDFFNFIVAQNISPIYICISGKWIEKHKEELAFIEKERGNCEIIWVNHSYSHSYSFFKKNEDNFMLDGKTDVNYEVIQNEIVMLESGILPSPFFRFPGLISNESLTNKILSYGLIPLGSNAWLALGETIEKGSIVLLHLNGNEPIGLELFMDFYKNTNLNPVSLVGYKP